MMKRRQKQKRKQAKKKTLHHSYKNSPAHENEAFQITFKINQALKTENFSLLREIGRESGFHSDAIRRRVWPFLLHCTDHETDKMIEGDLEVPHKDESQVKLDVIRSFNSFPKNIDEQEKEKLQAQLDQVITHVLRSYPSLHYYQGFHDICCVFILMFGAKYACKLMESVALFYLRDEMFVNMEPVLKQLTILDTLIRLKDQELYALISEAGVLPYYSLSWVITWCSHDLDDLDKLARLFDLFLCSNPFMPVYFAAAVVLSRRDQVLALPCDVSTIHSFLTKLPKDMDVQQLCQTACDLEAEYSVYDIQCLSQVPLDKESAVNRYTHDWIPLHDTNDLNRVLQDHIMPILKEHDRTPIDLVLPKTQEKQEDDDTSAAVLAKLRSWATKDIALYTLFTVSAGVGLLAIVMSNTDIVREWLTSGI